jgi:uncharacterized YigZ family protein
VESKDKYYTIEKQERSEIKIKRSRFIASAIPAKNKEIAMQELGTIRTEFYNARHNCFAYRIGADGMEFRYSDDGEPNGSAGNPILFSIKKYDVSDLIVVVTRFFGGIKLGVGGLARAYGEASDSVLEICIRKPVYITKTVRVFCTYEDLSAVKKIIDKFAVSFSESYHDAVEIEAEISLSQIDEFINMITESTSGRAGTLLRNNGGKK